MSIASEITRISNAKSSIASAITNKGVTVPSGTLLDGMPTLIGQIQTGITPSGNKALTPSTSAQTGIDVSTYATASVDAITKELLASLDADFVAENIKKDVDLFGLVGTLAGGGASNTKILDITIANNIAYNKELKVFSGDADLAAHYSDSTMTAIIFPTSTIDATTKDKMFVYGLSSNRGLYSYGSGTPNHGMFIRINSQTSAQTISSTVQYESSTGNPCVAIKSSGDVVIRSNRTNYGFAAGQYRLIFIW